MAQRFLLAALLHAALLGASHANTGIQTMPAAAPALSSCRVAGQRDLGRWDDAFNAPGSDAIVLRNGPDIFSLSLLSADAPRKLTAIPELAGSEIVKEIESNGRQWLFFQSKASAPFAVDLLTGKAVTFQIPGVKITSTDVIAIQSSVVAAHVGGAMFQLSGGDANSWPRPENRPLYFWFGVESGRTVQLPIGWDLLYFSADQKTAVFWKVHGEQPARDAPQFAGRPLAAVNMATGEVISDVPDRNRAYSIPFSWTEQNAVKPLERTYLPDTGARDGFAGVSVNGTPYPLDMTLEGVHDVVAAQAEGNRVVFILRPSGATMPSTLWWARLVSNDKPRLLGERPVSFETLGTTRVVYVTSGHGNKNASSEAFVFDAESGTAWNLLDSVARLPDLDAETASKSYVRDAMAIRLIGGFGSPRHTKLVLALFHQSRGDLRAFAPPSEPWLPSQQWHRAVLVAARGTRCTVDVPQPESEFTRVWLHNAGKFLVARDEWSGSTRRFRLSETTIALE